MGLFTRVVAVLAAAALPAHATAADDRSGARTASLLAAAPVTGSGNAVDDVRPVGPFTVLVLKAPVDVTLKAGAEERVTIRADDNIAPLIVTRVVGGQLEIDTRSGAAYRSRTPPRATVEFRKLEAIRIRGAGDVRAETIAAPVLEVSIGGSGDVTIDRVDVDALAVSVAGSGDVIARGRARSIGVVIEGSGDAKLADVEAEQVAVRVRGSGDVTVHAAQTLEVDLSGSSDVRYRGAPQLTKKVRGSGSVNPF